MTPGAQKPVILLIAAGEVAALVTESAARAGISLVAITNPGELASHASGGASGATESPEQNTGYEQTFLDGLTNLLPRLILLAPESLDAAWLGRLRWLKALPETRRIPVVCLLGEPTPADAGRYLSMGVDEVIPRQTAIADLLGLLRRYSPQANEGRLRASCQESLSPQALEGVRLFNCGQYFAAHEHLELAWMQDPSPGRDLYRALLQAAVAYYQIERQNYLGAVKMFLRLRQWIRPLPEVCRGVDVGALRAQLEAAFREVARLGPDRIAEFAPSRFPSLRLVA
ncbi:MAG: DUF309 domain-containing protein [Anaerolineales bacterium]|nr:DUF309 domain-containing protein [Anaerolineales bacterium]